MRSLAVVLTIVGFGLGDFACTPPDPKYGQEHPKMLLSKRPQVWAVAPVINLSGERGVDPFLQADLVYHKLQEVQGVTVIPVNRVAEVYAALQIDHVTSPAQAALVCDLLQCDGLVVSSVTIFDTYNPPKFGGSMVLFMKPATFSRPVNVDPRELARRATPMKVEEIPSIDGLVQAVGMFDAANGTVRDRIHYYSTGRKDVMGPMGEKEFYVVMDRYCEFVYSELIDQLLGSPKLKGM
jgi:hypothetical protein